MIRIFPMAAVVLALCMSLSSVTQPIFIPIHLLTFFVAAMVCHGELVRYRPSREHLTMFYLAMAVGGVLGGIFNALVAPLAFDRIVEYPLALVMACLVLPANASIEIRLRNGALDLVIPLALGVVMWGLVRLIQPYAESQRYDLAMKLLFGVAAFACYALKDRPVRFALALGAVLLASGTYTSNFGRVLYQHRNYFGILRVTDVASGNFHRLIHGHTLHGQQSLEPGRRREPLTYYHRTGPIGQVFDVFHSRPAKRSVAVAGLGAGTLACYAERGESWTFYEIDPAVERVARNPNYFTFLKDCRADSLETILGDARLKLKDAPEQGYGLIVLDAFSSDAIPTHLLTREAAELYRSKLAEGGLVAVHISNSYIDLVGVLGALARDVGLKCLVRRDLNLSVDDIQLGKEPSIWAVMSAHDVDFGGLSRDSTWQTPRASVDETGWTDDFSNVVEHLAVLHHNGAGAK
jgi:spermidine synthase